MNIEKLQDYQCSGCYACANACPKDAIAMEEDKEGFSYPIINPGLCIECGACDRACPKLANRSQESMAGIDSMPHTYAVISNHSLERQKSSSGGVFRLLAEQVIRQGGFVYGAAFNEKWEVCHVGVDNLSDLGRLQGSKYVQSRIGLVYRDIKKQLATGRLVLFSGTPCQCEGLYGYLGGIKYDNLFVVDLICHGVPSPLVWKHYIQYVCKLKKSTEISRISFRSKNLSWERYLLEFTFVNSSKYQNDLHTDIYMRGFLQDLYLRKSCYRCTCRKLHRISDITLADFWGIKDVLPSMYDGKGTSLVLIQSPKGERMFLDIDAKKAKVYFAQGIRGNGAYLTSPELNLHREKFFQHLNEGDDFITLMEECLKEPLAKRVRRKLSSVRILRALYHCIRS